MKHSSNGFGGAHPPQARRPAPLPKTQEELLDLQEALCWEGIFGAAEGLGSELAAATKLRERAERHPLIVAGGAVALGSAGGFLAARLALRAIRGLPRLLTLLETRRSGARWLARLADLA